ncbi:DIP1984 family protein [Chengkuizengella sp. SCS-71B]|uniref:DIP1984 family protein n=1 Tax=Chengkuizengella sp. SCS-71B TaxID=3115290 RepID=UPI0032C2305A
MRLAEALILRADLQRKISELRQRLERVVRVQEDEKPAEDPKELFAEIQGSIHEFTCLVKKINKTNSLTKFDSSQSIADVLAERDGLMQRKKVLDGMLEHSAIIQDRYSRSEIRYQSTIDVREIQKEIDNVSKKYRELDFKIQEKNWNVDLIE